MGVKKIYNKIFGSKGSFIKYVSMIVSGTVFAQMLTMLLSPVLTRIYTPEQFGIYGAFMALLGLISVSASLDVENAIPLEKDDNKAFHLLFSAFGILMFVCFMLFMLMLFDGEILLKMLNNKSLYDYRYLLVIGGFFVGLYKIVQQYAYREAAFKQIMITTYVQSIVGNGVKIVLGVALHSTIGLLIGTIISQCAGIGTLSASAVSKMRKIKYRYKWVEVVDVLTKYRQFPLYSAANNYVYSFSTALPLLAIISMYGSSASGNYSLANTVINVPSTFIGTAIGQVFYVSLAKFGREYPARMKYEARRLIIKMLVYGGLLYGGIALVAPLIVTFIFGNQWDEAGMFIRLISWNAFSSFLILPVGRIFEILNKQRLGFIFNSIRLGIIVLLFIVAGTMNWGINMTIGIYSLISGNAYLLGIWLVFYQIDKYENNLRRTF